MIGSDLKIGFCTRRKVIGGIAALVGAQMCPAEVKKAALAARETIFGKGGAKLPYDAEVEYLQANNTPYAQGQTIGAVIDTGIVANLDTDVWVCDAQFVSFGNTAGCWGRAGDRFAFGRGSASWYDWYYGLGNTNNRTSKSYDNNRHLFVLDGPNRRLTIDGVSYSGSGSAVAGSLTLAIFNRNNDNGISYCVDNLNSRCYSAKLYRSGVLIQDLIPVRFTNELGQSEGAMYDRVSGQLFRNAGTGSFVIGPDLT